MANPTIKNHYWKPNDIIINKLVENCKQNNYQRIVEIGPGITHFPLATEFIGLN